MTIVGLSVDGGEDPMLDNAQRRIALRFQSVSSAVPEAGRGRWLHPGSAAH